MFHSCVSIKIRLIEYLIKILNKTYINSNLLKKATITGTIQTEKNDYAIGGYLGVASLSSFAGYPTDATEIVGYTAKQTYYGGHLGISCLVDNNVVCIATVAATFTVKAEILYV